MCGTCHGLKQSSSLQKAGVLQKDNKERAEFLQKEYRIFQQKECVKARLQFVSNISRGKLAFFQGFLYVCIEYWIIGFVTGIRIRNIGVYRSNAGYFERKIALLQTKHRILLRTSNFAGFFLLFLNRNIVLSYMETASYDWPMSFQTEMRYILHLFVRTWSN